MSYPTLDRSRSFIALTYYRLWNARLAYLASLLILLLQRTPLVKILTDAQLALSAPRLAHIFKFTTVTSAVSFAGTHAVTGATAPVVTPTEGSTNPAEANVGEDFAWGFTASIPGKKARSYRIEGLPPGIIYDDETFPLSSSLALLQGVPTTPGTFSVEITAFHHVNFGGDASPTYMLTINVAGDVTAAPVLTAPLTDQVVSAGESLSLTVQAEGEALVYAWDKDGAPIPESDSSTLQLDEVTPADAGVYTVKIANAGGEISSTAQVQVATQEIPIPPGQRLYSLAVRESVLHAIGPDAATTQSLPITMEGHNVTGGAGLATDPTTGELFAVLKLDSPPNNEPNDRVLATLDPETGQAVLVGVPSTEILIKFAAIAFDAEGQLWGVTGEDKGAPAPETLYLIDKLTGAATEILALGNGDEGETLAFDPDRGLFFHASGGPAPQSQVFETIDPPNQTVTPIQVQGEWKEGKALTYLGDGQFLLADEDAFHLVSHEGAVTLVGTIDHATKGFALVAEPPATADFHITRVERTAEGIVLAFPAAAGENYLIEKSEDLVTWEELATGTVAEGQTEVVHTDTEITAEIVQRYYRASRG